MPAPIVMSHAATRRWVGRIRVGVGPFALHADSWSRAVRLYRHEQIAVQAEEVAALKSGRCRVRAAMAMRLRAVSSRANRVLRSSSQTHPPSIRPKDRTLQNRA